VYHAVFNYVIGNAKSSSYQLVLCCQDPVSSIHVTEDSYKTATIYAI